MTRPRRLDPDAALPPRPRGVGREGTGPGGVGAASGPGEGKAEGPAGVRLQRVLAAAGVAARRVCERLIEEGKVEVNGRVVRTLPAFVDPARDSIVVNGRTIPRVRGTGSGAKRPSVTALGGRLLYIMLYKPPRVVSTTAEDERTTIMDLVNHPAVKSAENPMGQRIFPVGRLDFHTAGMVLLTSDGELANRLTHPRYGVRKTYEALVRGTCDDAFIADLARGLNLKQARAAVEAGKRQRIGGGEAGITVTVKERRESKTLLEISFLEAGERPLGDMLNEAGLPVTRLMRTMIGPLPLRGVVAGGWRELERGEIRMLRAAAALEEGGKAKATR
ncbi:MAG: pseudouridine synthase, partial [Phycisphaerales bacterium]